MMFIGPPCHRCENPKSKSLLCVLSQVEAMNECLKGSLVRLTYGLVAPGVRDLCYADDRD